MSVAVWSPTSSGPEASRYTVDMDDSTSPLEDWRGVDIGQIRSQLRLTVAQRVTDMVHAANVMVAMCEHVQRGRGRVTTHV